MSRLLSSITDCLSQLLNSVPPPMHISYPGPRYILTSLISASRHGSSFMSLCYTRWLLYWAREEIWKSHKFKVYNFTDSHFFFILNNTTLNNHNLTVVQLEFNTVTYHLTTSFRLAAVHSKFGMHPFPFTYMGYDGYKMYFIGFRSILGPNRFFKAWARRVRAVLREFMESQTNLEMAAAFC